ncbi:hypothetical protein [uncultured Alistipes sp.]|uniref:hypothetical protein n=1 Tax=uncultured Alistipes sp. TaxID=538949 RepID=UPI00261A07F7|nr:hypothetical protein [uncultured Alistipes sp.]
MADTKIFSFPDAGAGANGIAAMLPALLQNRGVDPAYLMGMLNNGNGGFFGNNGGFQDIIALIVIAAIFGNGNGGLFGGGNGGGSYGNRTGYREDEDDEDWDDDNDRMGERRGRSSRTGRFVRR